MKLPIIFTLILISATPLSANKPVATAVCKLALENIELLKRKEEPEPWIRGTAEAFDLNLAQFYVDRARVTPALNKHYFQTEYELLSNIYSLSRKTMAGDRTIGEDRSLSIVSRVAPRMGETLLDYISKYANVSALTYYSESDRDTAVLNSVNHFLNVVTAYESNLIFLLLAELEVNHPFEYSELKNSVEIHSLYNLITVLEQIKARIDRLRLLDPPSLELQGAIFEREAVFSTFLKRRGALFLRLVRESKPEELYAAELLFGTGP